MIGWLVVDAHFIVDLLDQREYKYGVITDRNLESLMKNHPDPDYFDIVASGTRISNSLSLSFIRERCESTSYESHPKTHNAIVNSSIWF